MKIALIGYGKMGHMIEEIALQRGHEIVCKIDVNNPQDIDSPEFCSADVAIEFTNPTAAYGNYLKAFSHNVKVVSGSTGWMKDHKEDVEKLCADGKQTLFWASNFSIGVAIFSAVNRYLAKIMNGFPQYSVCMQETHHVHKLDAPSGTAITLAEEIIDNIDRKKDWKRGVTYWTEDGHHDEGDANITSEDEDGAEKISDTVLSLDAMPEDDVKSAAWLADSRDCMEELITALKEKELLSILTEKQRELYLAMTREGLTLREFARRKGIGIRAAFDLKAAVQKKFQRIF